MRISARPARKLSSCWVSFSRLRLQPISSFTETGSRLGLLTDCSPGWRIFSFLSWETWTSPAITLTREPLTPEVTLKTVPVTATRQSAVALAQRLERGAGNHAVDGGFSGVQFGHRGSRHQRNFGARAHLTNHANRRQRHHGIAQPVGGADRNAFKRGGIESHSRSA